MYRIFILAAICMYCFIVSVKATGQVGERIIIGQDTLAMLACPIEQDSVLARQVQERLSGKGFSTGLWRGYIGLWRLEDGKLFLEKLEEERYEDQKIGYQPVDISGIFDAYREDGRILARWFNGDIRVVEGELVAYQHIGFARHYERETIYTLRNGEVKSQKEVRNSLRKSRNAKYYYTMNLLFNGKGMKWVGDSVLEVEVIPKPDGTVDRVKVTQYLRALKSAKREESLEKMKARLERLKAKRNPSKAKNRYWSKSSSKVKKYGRYHPYTRELMACAGVMDGWEVVTLDGKVQPQRLRIIGKKDWSQLSSWDSYRLREQLDLLEVDGAFYRMNAFPLQQNPDLIVHLRPHLKGAFSEKNPRGYRARWKIADDRLWLTEIRNARTGMLIPLSAIVTGNDGSPVEAAWYTGRLEVATGGLIDDWDRTERHEIVYEIEQGRIIHRTAYDNYIQPGDEVAYNCFVDELRSHDWMSYPELKNRSLHGNFEVYPRLNGRADSIVDIRLFVNGNHDEERYHREISDPADPWIMLVRRAAEAVKRWEVRFIRGEVKPVTIYFNIKEREEEQKKKITTDDSGITIDLREIGGGKNLQITD